jgi:hypothetical protein
MDKMEFLENQLYIKRILDILAEDQSMDETKRRFYILGDMGMSDKNYGNWGRRMNGDIVVLDYGYLYQLTNEAWKEVARCPMCGSSLEYTKDYSELECTKTECRKKSKYTTLRNTQGYGSIIENIKENLIDDKYVKFNNKGEITVDVMDRIEIEEKPKAVFVMPEEIECRINKAKEQFFLVTEQLRYSDLSLEDYYELKEEIMNSRDEYDEMLFPFVLASIELNTQNVEKYIKDFNKFAEARYEKLYKELKEEFDEENDNEEEVEDIPDCFDDFEGYSVKGYESELKIVDRYSDNGDSKVVSTTLDDLLGAEINDAFSFAVNAEDPSLDDMNDEFSLDHIMNLLNINAQLMNEAEEKIAREKEQEEQEKLDADYKIYVAEKELEDAYKELEDALTSMIRLRYKEAGCLFDDDEYTTGDVYRTYLNGDYIDLDYSPRVNAKNILGGWRVNEFAFPLYRHLLIKFDYDMDQIEQEYQAIYRIDDELEPPKDLYGTVENRNVVIGQIMNRFEDSMKPARPTLIMNIGNELNRYYKAMDEYYEVVKPAAVDVDINDSNYYLTVAEESEHTTKLLREAKAELKEELADKGYNLDGLMDEYKIVYYYDIESIMSNTELNVMNLVQEIDLRNVKNIKEHILNEYYKKYNSIITDSVFDIFKYNGAIEKEEGCLTHPRIVKPRIKAKLVDKDSTLDTFKPEIFNRTQYKVLSIEQRYDLVVNISNPEEITELHDIILNLNRRNVYYSERMVNKYNVKRTKDNMRYGLSEKEISLVEEFEDRLSIEVIRDVDKVVKRTIVDLMNEEYNMCEETKEFMYDLANSDLSEAYANRLMKINLLEINGKTTRLEYLTHVE